MTLLIRKHGCNVGPREGEEVVGKEGEAMSCSKVKESLLWGAVCACVYVDCRVEVIRQINVPIYLSQTLA